MHLLLTNDDGYEAPGLQHLATTLSRIGLRVTVVAPDRCWSHCGHSVTAGGPMKLLEAQPDRYRLQGSPADCVRVALGALQLHPDWVISGINAGANLGTDIWESGTVAAAREAALHGYPAIAISQYRHPSIDLDWPSSAIRASQLLNQIYSKSRPGTGLWNLNLPALATSIPLPEMVQCTVDTSRRPLVWRRDADSVHAAGDYHQRPRRSGSDVDHCFSGSPSLSWISLNHSNEP